MFAFAYMNITPDAGVEAKGIVQMFGVTTNVSTMNFQVTEANISIHCLLLYCAPAHENIAAYLPDCLFACRLSRLHKRCVLSLGRPEFQILTNRAYDV